MSLHPKIIDLTLDRMWSLLAALGHPERALPGVVHIAGTNGKGSTLAMIRAGLEAAGRTTNVYTSPHLARFHERIRLHGRLIEEPAFEALLDDCERLNGGRAITFFEITTCAALLAFARRPADHTLLETGLGGRLDATNVVAKPALTVITPVSLDHQQYLGETVELIAAEKAGILKPGTPCVVGPQTDGALAVIEARAEAIGAPLLVSGRDWQAWSERGRLIFQDGNGLLDLDLPALPGAHQVQNAGAALAALRALGVDDAACAGAMAQVRWPARLQRLDPARLPGLPADAEVWLDGGHNEAAGEALAAHMAALQARRPAPLHLVCGMLETKDPTTFLRHFNGLADHVAAIAIPDAAASLPAEAIMRAAAASGIPADAAADFGAAIADTGARAAQAAAALSGAASPRILICGSLYLAGWVLRQLAPPD
ncbi:MAG: folylpolyglutamate synthase/dihydrofolate synthase family protein [Pseudomonadota bacterium]|nr:folylpolyglutamate synthase/dihydrofolate synthase family protein [Pseudomonadota bacterium]MEE3098164.1 folylpolyglutamate synthase/dihydrofolate synthase family protein [Pseudomonadota bacterium]